MRIWTDNQTVWHKTNRLLGGASVRPNAPHSDLLSDIQVFIAEHNLADRVTVHKVTSHCDTEFAFDNGEAWIFWHNKLVDAAADGFNARRPFAFWSKLEEVRTAVQFSRQLVLDIWEVIVHIGRLQSQCKLPTDDVAGSEEPQPVEVVEPIPEPVVEQRHYPQALIRMYGANNIRRIDSWWNEVGEPALRQAGKLRWVSGLQLFLDYWTVTHHSGPLSVKHGQWFESPEELPNVTLNCSNRTIMFLRVWNAVMKSRGQHISKKLMRPSSSVIACWVMSYRLPWPSARLDELDRKLLTFFGRQVVKCTDLTRLCLDHLV